MIIFEVASEDAEFLLKQQEKLFVRRASGKQPGHDQLTVVGGSFEAFKAGQFVGEFQVNISDLKEL